MAYEGFKKLTEKLKAEGLKNPSGAAAAIGMRKYGKKRFEKAAHEHKSMEHMKPKK